MAEEKKEENKAHTKTAPEVAVKKLKLLSNKTIEPCPTAQTNPNFRFCFIKKAHCRTLLE
jgi:hypothetical protein